MIIAQYTIRSKQDYIFKTNKVLEIVGASENIARIWNELFNAANRIGLKYQRVNEPFNFEKIKQKFDDGTLDFVELFCGGGNETMLFSGNVEVINGKTVKANDDSPITKLNREFSYKLLKDYPGMTSMVVFTDVKEDYCDDYDRLMAEAERKKNVMEPEWDIFTVPFAMMDRETFQPYSKVKKIGGNDDRMSDETYGKYEVGARLKEDNQDVRLFDDMVTQKGKESLLAVVHADGNNMGSKIMEMLHGETDYDKAVALMREFTSTTADCFEKEGDAALKRCQFELLENNDGAIKSGKIKKSSLAYRRIIGSGDDVTFICNARFVMQYVKAYLSSVQEYQKKKNSKWNYSSCAGICIFHSHYPFSRAYSIAEQACECAKRKVHISDETGKPINIEQGWMDFHFIHSGIDGDLEEIRRSQGTDKCIARPWLVTCENSKDTVINGYVYDDLLKLKKIFDKKRDENGKESYKGTKVSRTAIKTIGSAYERSESAAKKELIALYGHTPGLERDIEELYPNEGTFLKAVYDFAEIYDIWYTEV